jgi:proteasome lid subunit RPN8/RPN11
MMKIVKVTRHDEPRFTHLSIPFEQNHLPIILIQREVIEEIYAHAAEGYPNEVAGYYVGFPLQDITSQRNITYIEKSIRAISTASHTYVTMHPESFREVEAARQQSGTILVGYYHSHPGLSVFQSDTDLKNFRDYHIEPYQIAIVVDSTRTSSNRLDVGLNWIGFFGWDQNHNPTKIPACNIKVVDKRPEIIQHSATAERDNPINQSSAIVRRNVVDELPERTNQYNQHSIIEIETEIKIVQNILNINDILRSGCHKLNKVLPIIMVSKNLINGLNAGNVSDFREGVLLGTIINIAGYTFVRINTVGELKWKSWWDFLNPPTAIREVNGEELIPVGFYSSGYDLYKIDRVKGLPKYDGKYYLGARFSTQSILFEVLNSQDKSAVQVPYSQIILNC